MQILPKLKLSVLEIGAVDCLKIFFELLSLLFCEVGFWMILDVGRQWHLEILNLLNAFFYGIVFYIFIICSPNGKIEMFSALIDVIFYGPRNGRNVGIARILGFVGVTIVTRVFENRADFRWRIVYFYKILCFVYRLVCAVNRDELNCQK